MSFEMSCEDYKTVGSLTKDQIKELVEFLQDRGDSPMLIDMVNEHKEFVNVCYRGIRYRKRDLVVSNEYSHWHSLSSWSMSKEVAVKFALNTYLPEELLEDTVEEKGYDRKLEETHPIWKEADDEFGHVLFIAERFSGFVVKNHIDHFTFGKEQEVIGCEGRWEIVDIKEIFDHSKGIYYEVKLKEMV